MKYIKKLTKKISIINSVMKLIIEIKYFSRILNSSVSLTKKLDEFSFK